MSAARDFLVEVGTEELPPLALPQLEKSFAEGLRAALDEAALAHGEIRSFATPRRLAVLVRDLAAAQSAQSIKLKGPPVNAAFKDGAPTRRGDQVRGEMRRRSRRAQTRDRRQGRVPVLRRQQARPNYREPAAGHGAACAGPAADSQAHALGFVERGVRAPGALAGAAVRQRARTGAHPGHRRRQGHARPSFHGAAGSSRWRNPADYEATLRERGKVIADFSTRRALIREQVTALGKSLGGAAIIEDELLDEVTALVEWPSAIAGGFEPRFLELPREVLISTLQHHQRYFPVENAAGKLLAHFITVSNIESRDPAKVRAGNERVVRPRLSDAAFFWSQDRKQPLHARRLPALDAVTFQAKLGSIGDKVRRMAKLAGEIALLIDTEASKATRAAELAKCDLLTSMVGEFPELQGIMGRYYATADGEPADVAAAIDEHYMPRAAGGALPAHQRRNRRRPGRQARHAGRHLRHRPETQRHQGSVRPAPRRHRRAAHTHREKTGAGSARAGEPRRGAAARAEHDCGRGAVGVPDRTPAQLLHRQQRAGRRTRRQHRDVRCGARQ